MSRILFVAELGGGYGHVKRLLPIARAALRRGYHPLFLVPNPAEVAPFLVRERLEVEPTPIAAACLMPTAPRPRGVAATYADILGAIGFDEAPFLERAAATWDARLAALRPAAVICEMSPFLNLACFGAGWPTLVVGHGFGLPPPHRDHFSQLWPGNSLFSERELLAAAQEVCRVRGRPTPPALPALFGGSVHAVTGLEVLDPYRSERLLPAVGPPGLDLPVESPGPRYDVFAYLSGSTPLTLRLLAAMAASGLRGRVFVRGGDPAHRRALDGSGFDWLDEPLPSTAVAREARCVVHHAGMLTAEEALIAGTPQVVAPLYLENLLTAKALAGLGVAAVARPTHSVQELTHLLKEAVQSRELVKNARAFASAHLPTVAKLRGLPDMLLQKIVGPSSA